MNTEYFITEYISNCAQEITRFDILRMLEKEKRKIGLEGYDIVLFAAEKDIQVGKRFTLADETEDPNEQDYSIWIYPITLSLGSEWLRRAIRHELFHIKSDVLRGGSIQNESERQEEEINARKYEIS